MYVVTVLVVFIVWFCFFFKQKTAYEMRIIYWSSDVCSSDLDERGAGVRSVLPGQMDRDRLRARRAVRDAALDGDPDRRNARAHRCGHAPEEPAWRLCRCGRLEPGARPSSTVASDTAACCPTACPCRLAARLSPRSQSRCSHAARPGVTPMKIVLAASALAFIATSAQAQTTTPQPAPAPIADAKASPAPRQPTPQTIARKRVNPMA